MLNISKIAGLAIVAALALPVAANAAITQYNLESGGDGSLSGSGYGNSLTITKDGIQLRVTSYGATNLPGPDDYDLDPGQLRQFSGGLGTCNQNEGLYCGVGPHTIDNSYADDFVLLKFDQVVDFVSLAMTVYADNDYSYWVGTTALASLTGLEPFEFGANGFGTKVDGSGSSINLTGLSGNAIIFAARVPTTDSDDEFKLKTVRVEGRSQDVPEPAVLGLVGFGLLGVAAAVRRRRTA